MSETPNPIQRLRYICGGTLPDSMRDWVRNDLTGPGAQRRYLTRFLVPVVPVLALLLLIPGPLWMGAAMMALLLLPLAYFTIALSLVYRRHRLIKHGLDPDLADAEKADHAEAVRRAYEQRHGRA